MMQQEPLVTATVSRRRSARDRVRQRPGLIERLMPLPWEMWSRRRWGILQRRQQNAGQLDFYW